MDEDDILQLTNAQLEHQYNVASASARRRGGKCLHWLLLCAMSLLVEYAIWLVSDTPNLVHFLAVWLFMICAIGCAVVCLFHFYAWLEVYFEADRYKTLLKHRLKNLS